MTADFWEIIAGRRSIRRYKDQIVPMHLVEQVLSAALRAPSAHNSQPWRFAVISSPEKKYDLARAMAVKLDQDLRKQSLPFRLRLKKLRRSMKLFTQAPVVIIPFLTDSTQNAKLKSEQERIMAVQSVALAAGQLLLAATASGLGACWYAAPLFCPEVIRQQLELQNDWEPQAFITLGYPDELPVQKEIKRLDDICIMI